MIREMIRVNVTPNVTLSVNHDITQLKKEAEFDEKGRTNDRNKLRCLFRKCLLRPKEETTEQFAVYGRPGKRTGRIGQGKRYVPTRLSECSLRLCLHGTLTAE